MNNAISNGGNQAGMWRTLTYSEWTYLIDSRADASNKYGIASVNNVNGLVLLPDNWTIPTEVTFISGTSGNYTQNTYSVSDWSKMEANGAVFLPAAGNRNGTDVVDVDSGGVYWSSSAGGYYVAYFLSFGSNDVDTNNSYRSNGQSVRLVQDAE